MSSGTQVDFNLTGVESPSPDRGQGGQTPPSSAPNRGGSGAKTYLTDEEILGMEPVGTAANIRDVIPSPDRDGINSARNLSSIDDVGNAGTRRDSSGENRPRNDNEKLNATEQASLGAMPAWMQTLAGDPVHGAEAQRLWQEHQAYHEYRAAFASPDEARAIKELFPGGAQEAQTLRQAAQSVDRIDAAIFSGDARAQSEVISEIARANPAAFRSLVAEASKVLARMGMTISVVGETAPTLRPTREEWGTRQTQNGVIPNEVRNPSERTDRGSEQSERDSSSGLSGGPPRNDGVATTASATPQFDPAAYVSFERSTNDIVARDVRTSISDTLSRVLPDGVAEGAARRIGDDIFNEIHRALAADRTLSEQVADVLRDRRFGTMEQQRVTSLLAGRAKQLVPSVARRVIGEWTSSVLGTARTKAARQAAASSRVDIAAAGGSLDSMPLRAMSAREVDYASMSDDEILGL